MELRPYQQQFIADLRAAMAHHRHVLGVMPTGAGKTICFSYITASALEKSRRVTILVHRGLILDQISDALEKCHVPHGRIQPSWPMTSHPVQIGMVQTAARRWGMYEAPDLVIADEAHHVASPTYTTLLARWPNARSLGVTATPERLDGRGLGAHFSALVAGPEIPWLIEHGFLADYDYYAPSIQVDFSRIRAVAGDYARDDLADALDRPTITGDAVAHYRRYAAGRPAIAFCVSISHAEHVAADFAAAGFAAASIDGSMAESERRARLHGLADGSLHVLTSCDLIGEGIDVPAVAAIIHLRPTRSLALAKQMSGRGLRIKPDGGKAVILDHVGNQERHGTPRSIHAWSLDSRRRRASESTGSTVRQCRVCFRVFEAGERDPCESTDPGCLMRAPVAAPPPAVVAGELARIDDSPAWAAGASLTLARGAEWKTLLSRAETTAQLTEIARARGYKRGWIRHIIARRGISAGKIG